MGKIKSFGIKARRRTSRHSSTTTPATIQINLSGSMARRLLKSLLSPVLPPTAPVVSQSTPNLRPTLKPWAGLIDRMIAGDATRPKRLRTSAMQVFQTLRDEHEYPGCYNAVQEYIYAVINPERAEASRLRQSQNARKGRASVAPQEIARTAEVTSHSPEATECEHPSVPSPDQRHSLVPRNPSLMLYRNSLRLHKEPEPQDQALAWMRNLQQGAIPLDVLTPQLPDIPFKELEILLLAATKGKLAERNRAVTVMSYVRGINRDQICSFLQISTGSLFRYWRDFREGGSTQLLTRKERSDKLSNQEDVKSAIFALLHSPPSAHGVNRTTWTIATLEEILSKGSHPAGAATIRTVIKEAGFKWRHARVVLTSNDPEYRAKVEAISKILSELRPDEAFFSVDEYGPFAIKMKGGKKRVAPGEQYVVPQWKKSKGWMILTAALELSRNQVTHFYSRKKNTGEMIKMADTLRDQYRSCKTLYLSWDAASWHISKDLVAHLEKLNQRAEPDGYPVIRIAPLPAGAQFLNVIESVFSGMARAIIHNSDYPSAEKATEAINRYFADRNAHYTESPKKAGDKIWGKERVACVFAEGQNCKDPMYQYNL
jgi:transposase